MTNTVAVALLNKDRKSQKGRRRLQLRSSFAALSALMNGEPKPLAKLHTHRLYPDVGAEAKKGD